MFEKKSNLNRKMKIQKISLFDEKFIQKTPKVDKTNKVEITVEDLLMKISHISEEVESAVNKYFDENTFLNERVVLVKDLSLDCLADAARRLSKELNVALCNSFSALQRSKEENVIPKNLVFNLR
jgi:hypothetical protein